MADITMCKNKDCKTCNSCYRFKATPSEYQSYVVITETIKKGDDCRLYWPVNNEQEFKKLEEEWQD